MTKHEKIKALPVSAMATILSGFCLSVQERTCGDCSLCLLENDCLFDTEYDSWIEWLESEATNG